MPDNQIIAMSFADLLNPHKRARLLREHRVRNLFRDRDHARQVWDDMIEGEEPDFEDAHYYLNMIGDGAYCAV